MIESILLRFGEVVGWVPAFRYQESREKMHGFARSALRSPLPGSRIRAVCLYNWCEKSGASAQIR